MVFFKAFYKELNQKVHVNESFCHYDVDIRKVDSSRLVVDIQGQLDLNEKHKTFYFNNKKVTHRVLANKNTTIDLSKEHELDACIAQIPKKLSSLSFEIFEDLCWEDHHKDNF